MNYVKIYDSLINKAKNRKLENVYIEGHHIIPRFMGGSDDKENLASLLAKEHFIAHLLLCKIYPDNYELLCALNMMCNFKRYEMNNKKYEWVRIKFAKELSKNMKGKFIGDKNYFYNHKFIGKDNHFYGKHHTEETKKIISEKTKGVNNAMYGKVRTEEEKEKIRKKLKSNPKIECAFCHKKIDKSNYARWHGIKCKQYDS